MLPRSASKGGTITRMPGIIFRLPSIPPRTDPAPNWKMAQINKTGRACLKIATTSDLVN